MKLHFTQLAPAAAQWFILAYNVSYLTQFRGKNTEGTTFLACTINVVFCQALPTLPPPTSTVTTHTHQSAYRVNELYRL